MYITRKMVHSIMFLVTAITAWHISNQSQYTRVVETKDGRVRGEEVSADGIRFKAFKGIPYARPPTGNLRFRAPERPLKWSDIRNTVEYGSVCIGNPQVKAIVSVWEIIFNLLGFLTYLKRELLSSEDCLTLNVFTTQFGETGLRPVLVWIHGGGFFAVDGTDSLYGPQYLVNEDIVVVTMNYRLGPLGFLSTNSSHASGNWGLKDQVAALKWVQDNIAQFGGDPKKVTIYGESAGGVSTHLHLFSPLSKGLFHQIISSSGVATADWAIISHQERLSKNLARLAGASESEIDDPSTRVRFLRSVKAGKLVQSMWDVLEKKDYVYVAPAIIPFVPVVEPPGTPNAFLTEDPKAIVAEGKFARVPLMMGFNSLEAAVLYVGSLQTGVERMNACPDVSRRISNVYFKGRPTRSSPLNIINLLDDAWMNFSIRQSQKWHAKYATANSSTYFYYFTFDGKWNIMKNWFSLDTFPGATHSDDLSYIFGERMKWKPHLQPNSPEHITRKRMISFITNFVKYGNPTPAVSALIPVKWKHASGIELNTMVIGEDISLEKDILEERMNLWSEMYRKYEGTPFDTL